MRSIDTWSGLKHATPAVVILGALSMSACQSSSSPDERQQDTHRVSPTFDCTGANYFLSAGSNGYVRAAAEQNGNPVDLESVELVVPATDYHITITVDKDGRAAIPSDKPLPRKTGELSIFGIIGSQSDLCSTEYHPLNVYEPPKPDKPARR